MGKVTLNYQSKIALRNYSFVFALIAMSVAALLIGGASTEMILLKIPAVPLGFLAWKGIYSFYTGPIYERKVTLRAFECSVLQAFVSSFVIYIFLWQQDKSAVELLKEYLFAFAWFFVLHMVLMITRVYENAKKRDASA